jgi:hypothetical protein
VSGRVRRLVIIDRSTGAEEAADTAGPRWQSAVFTIAKASGDTSIAACHDVANRLLGGEAIATSARMYVVRS